MGVSLIFKIAAVGILVTILSQVLKHSGREEHAFLVSLAGLILVLTWIVPYIYDLFQTIQSRFCPYGERGMGWRKLSRLDFWEWQESFWQCSLKGRSRNTAFTSDLP